MITCKQFPQLLRYFILFCLVILSNLFVSCSSEIESETKEQIREESILEAEHWVDNNKPERSIELLTPYLNSSEVSHQQNRIRQVLASAYIRRSGVDLVQFVSFLRNLKRLVDESENLNEVIEEKIAMVWAGNPELEPKGEAKKAIVSFYRVLFFVGDIFEILESLPRVEESGRTDLIKAIQILSIENSLTPLGQKLYRASLRLILINGNLRQKKYFSEVDSCPMPFDTFSSQIFKFQDDLILFLQDLKVAIPASKKDIDNILLPVKDFSSAQLDENSQEEFEKVLVLLDWIKVGTCDE